MNTTLHDLCSIALGLLGGERFRGKSEKGFEKSMVAAGNGPSIANQRLLQYVT